MKPNCWILALPGQELFLCMYTLHSISFSDIKMAAMKFCNREAARQFGKNLRKHGISVKVVDIYEAPVVHQGH